MGFTIHQEAVKKQLNWTVGAPDQAVPDPLPEGWSGTPMGGLPVMQIPHLEFPVVVYMHPNQPYRTIEHRNDKFELVGTEVVPTEHLTKAIGCKSAHKVGCHKACQPCNELLQAALSEGWVEEPYIPKSGYPATEEATLYGPKSSK